MGNSMTNEQARELVVGVRYSYYGEQWGKERVSLNYAALFFGLFWMAYRKMYWQVALAVGALGVMWTTLGLAGASSSNATAVSCGIAGLFGAAGNYWYRQHVDRLILRERARTSELGRLTAALTHAGGTSWGGPVAVAVILVALALFGN